MLFQKQCKVTDITNSVYEQGRKQVQDQRECKELLKGTTLDNLSIKTSFVLLKVMWFDDLINCKNIAKWNKANTEVLWAENESTWL